MPRTQRQKVSVSDFSFHECFFQILQSSTKTRPWKELVSQVPTGTCIWEKVTESLLCVRHWAKGFYIHYTLVFITTQHCTITNRRRSLDSEQLAIFTQLAQSRTRLGIQLRPAPEAFLFHSFPLVKMLHYTPRGGSFSKPSSHCPFRPHSARAALIAPPATLPLPLFAHQF